MKNFSIGDVVEYVGPPRHWTKGDVHIIAECQRYSGTTQYATNRGAWFTNDDFELIRKADEASFAQLEADLDDEMDDEEEQS